MLQCNRNISICRLIKVILAVIIDLVAYYRGPQVSWQNQIAKAKQKTHDKTKSYGKAKTTAKQKSYGKTKKSRQKRKSHGKRKKPQQNKKATAK